MKSRTIRALAAVAFFLSIFLPMTPAADLCAADQPVVLKKITLGYMPILGFAPFFVALEKGYFKEQGLEVELQRFRGGSLMIAPLSTGHLDIGGGETGPALFNAVNQDLDIRVAGALAAQPKGFGAVPCLVRKNLFISGEVTKPADLAGRKIAVNVGRGTAEYLLSEVLAKGGLTLDDVEMVTLPFPEMPAALANSAVDAAILPHPLAAKAIKTSPAEVLVQGDEITDFPQNGVIYFGRDILGEKSGATGTRFLIAYLKAARDLWGEGWRSEENAGIINKYTKVPVGTIRQGVPYYFDPDGRINLQSTEKFQNYYFQRGYTELDAPLPLERVIEDSFLTKALDQLGPFKNR